MQWRFGRRRFGVLGAVAPVVLSASIALADLVVVDRIALGDGQITRDTDTGLDWLDVTLTVNLSYNDVVAGVGGFSAAGFRHATAAEVCALFATHALAPVPCPSDTEATDPSAIAQTLITLLGATQSGGMLFSSFQITSGVVDDGSTSGGVGFARLERRSSGIPSSSTSDSQVRNDAVDPALVSSVRGHFLVRPTPPPPALPRCDDGTDNDGDGLTDFPDDPDCARPDDPTEFHLEAGDLLVADAGADAGGTGAVFRIDPQTGFQTSLTSGGFLIDPYGLAVEPLGDIFISDPREALGTGAVYRFDPLTGTQAVVSESAQLVDPSGLAREASGDLVYVDPGADSVFRFNFEFGVQSTVSSGIGLPAPMGIAPEASGDLLVSDPVQQSVMRVRQFGAGAPTTVAFGGLLQTPHGIAIDAQGDLLLADGDAVLRIEPVFATQSIVSSGGSLQALRGIAIEAGGDVVVSDRGANGVLRVDPTDGAQTVISFGGDLRRPGEIAVVPGQCTDGEDNDGDGLTDFPDDPDCATGDDDAEYRLVRGDIVVADFGEGADGTGRVLRIDPASGAQTLIAERGHFVDPLGIAIDERGDLLVVDFGLFGIRGAVHRIHPETGARSVVALGGSLINPLGIAIGPSGDLFVSDWGANAVFRLDPATGDAQVVVSEAAGAPIFSPYGLAFDAAGQLYVSDADGDTLIRVDPDTGAHTVVLSGPPLVTPRGVGVEASGHVLLADSGANEVFRIDPDGGAPVVAGSSGLFQNLRGLALQENGQILLSDPALSRIIRLDPLTAGQGGVAAGGLLQTPAYLAVVPDLYDLCGDLTGDHRVDAHDIELLREALTGASAAIATPEQCNVVGPSDPVDADGDGLADDCDLLDLAILIRASRALPPGAGQLCL